MNDWESGDDISVDQAKEELEEARFGCWGQSLERGPGSLASGPFE